MTLDTDTPTPAEIADFLGGTLPAARRLVVATHLATDAAAGAQALATQAQTERLRAAMSPLAPVPVSVTKAADALAHAMRRRRRIAWARPVAAAVACFVLGWVGQMLWQAPAPQDTVVARLAPLAEAAMDARAAADIARALNLPAALAPGDLARAAAQLGVSLPSLPADWRVRGVQVVATPTRPALLVRIDAPNLGEITLFSLAASDLGPDAPPAAFDYRGAAVAVFERGSSAHVLVDAGGMTADLSRAAGQLARRVN